MSAFLCSDVQTYAAALITLGATGSTIVHGDDVRNLATTYRALNNYAMRARYNDEGTPLDPGSNALDRAVDWIRNHSTADCCQVLRCLRYQCSEGACETQPGWDKLTAACDAVATKAGKTVSSVWSI